MSGARWTRGEAEAALTERGLRPETIEHFRIECDLERQGWRFPVGSGWKLKSFPNGNRKNCWDPAKPEAGADLYGLEGIEDSDSILLVEGEPDVWIGQQVGLPAVSFTGGAITVPAAGVRELAGTRKPVTVLYDADEAGQRGGEAVTRSLCHHGVLVTLKHHLGLPVGGDLTTLYLSLSQDDACLREALERLPGREHLPTPVRLTDTGNAARFVEKNRSRLRYCGPLGGWFVWDGRRWAEDEVNEVMRYAKATAKSIYVEAADLEAKDERDKQSRWGSSSLMKHRLEAMEVLARPELAVRVSAFDTDRVLLNLANGTLDLCSFEFREHRPSDLITKLTEVEFDPHAGAPGWNGFLEEVLPDLTVRQYVQRAVGYSLVGQVRDHVLFLPYGPGANGKSVFLEVIHHVAGEYGRRAEPGLLLEHRSEQHPTGVADLRGARFVSTVEPDREKVLAESLVKTLTGGDRVKARRMRQDFFEFDPTWTVWMACNHRPTVRGTDEGIWRRLKLIPFSVVISPELRDLDLSRKLKKEAPGVLKWALEGLREYWRIGLAEPHAVTFSTDEYRAEMNALGLFLDERTQPGKDFFVEGDRLYSAWEEWCRRSGERAGTKTAFGRRMSETQYERGKVAGRRGYFGLRLLHDSNHQRLTAV